jgi:acylphosphatase
MEGSPDEKVSAHIIFTGIVQGVFFRATTRRHALKLGLQGWVRNLPDGTVEAWVEGDRPTIDELVDYCKVAIAGARVDRVEIEEAMATDDYTTFEILR